MKSAVLGLSLFACLVCAQAKIVTKTAQRAWNQMQLFFQEIFGTGKTS